MLFLQAAQWYLKRTAEERMEEETLITLTVPAASVQWEKKDKEFSLNGRMFDVKSYRITNGIITATGYYDEKESGIIQLLLSLPHGKNKTGLLQIFWMLQCFSIALAWWSELTVYRYSRILPAIFYFILPDPIRLAAEKPPMPGRNIS